MNKFSSIFNMQKPVIGVLHLGHLDGAEFTSVKSVVSDAKNDIQSLQVGGINGILIENWMEKSNSEFVSRKTAENFRKVLHELSSDFDVPFGVNVLNNDYKLAFSLAKEFGASYVQLDVFVDHVISDFQHNQKAINEPFEINPNPNVIWSYAQSIDAHNIPLFAFVQPKHYKMVDSSKTIEQSTKQAIENNASAVLVTRATGYAPTMESIKRVKAVSSGAMVGIGSGFDASNARSFLNIADFAVVGTSIKIDKQTNNRVDSTRVAELMEICREMQTQFLT